jgi:hypothetical protein
LLSFTNAVTIREMNALLTRELCAYLEQTAGLNIELVPSDQRRLPFFLRGRYDLAQTTLYGQAYVFFAPKPDFDEWTPSTIQSDRRQLKDSLGRLPVFVAKGVDANQRHRLIQLRIPFIVPGRQMYLPDLLIDLREHFAAQRSKPVRYLSPSAQVIFLIALEQRIGGFESALQMADRANYTAMTVGRAMDELEAVGLASIIRNGKNKALSFSSANEKIDWRALWDKALPHLRTPVRRSFPLYTYRPALLEKAHLGGLSALARYSTLNEPSKTVWAISADYYRNNTVELEGAQAAGIDWGKETLEIWTYDPGLSAEGRSSWIRDPESQRGGVVDRLSLFLALREETDERVQQALERMIEEIKW